LSRVHVIVTPRSFYFNLTDKQMPTILKRVLPGAQLLWVDTAW
jgi:hypothetical protein